MHDIISDILDWDEAQKVYVAGEGVTGERFGQRLDAADRMAKIEARWQHLPGGFHRERKRIKTHIRAVAEEAPTMGSEELCWLAIAAASAWIPSPAQARETPRRSAAVTQVMCFAAVIGALAWGPSPVRANIVKSTPSQVKMYTCGSDSSRQGWIAIPITPVISPPVRKDTNRGAVLEKSYDGDTTLAATFTDIVARMTMTSPMTTAAVEENFVVSATGSQIVWWYTTVAAEVTMIDRIAM